MAKLAVASSNGNKGKGGRKAVDPNETKGEKFSRLGSARLNNALKQIRGLNNLASAAYESTPQQVDKIEALLTEAVRDAVKALRNPGKTPAKGAVTL